MKEIIDSIAERVVLTDPGGKVGFANRAFLKGFALSNAIGMGLPELLRLPDAEAARVKDFMAGQAAQGEPSTLLMDFTTAEGWRTVIELEARALRKPANGLVKAVTVRDLTESVKMEDILQRYAEGLTILYELSNVFLSTNGMQRAIRTSLSLISSYYDADMMQVLLPVTEGGEPGELEVVAGIGFGGDELVGTRLSIDRDNITCRCLFEKCPTVVTDFSVEKDIKLPEMHLAHGVQSGICIPMVFDDKVLGVLGVLYKAPRDIDTAELWYMTVVANTLAVYLQKERSLNKLENSERFLTSILEGIGEGVVVVDKDFNILTANDAYVKSLRMDLGDAVGRKCYEVSHRIDKPCYEAGEACTVRGVFATGRHHEAVHTHFDKGGEPVYVQTNAYPVRDGSGKVVAAVETVMDITERMKLEKDLEKRVAELEEFYEMAVGRELRMIELKEEIQGLRQQIKRLGG